METRVTGFVNWLCEHVCIVRTGPEARKMGDPYEEAVTGVFDPRGFVKLQGFSGKASMAHVRAAMKVINDAGFDVQWERAGSNPRLLVQTEGVQGRQTMKVQKIKPPHGRDVPRTTVGKPDWSAMRATIAAMDQQFDAGHYTMDDCGQVDPSNGTNADEKAAQHALRNLKSNQVFCWFVRGETTSSI